MQSVNTFVRVAVVLLLAIAAFFGWYVIAANYDYSAVSGTYALNVAGETSTLILSKDRSFQQELSRDGKIERTEGSWRRIGEGGVVFSKEFLKVSDRKSGLMAKPMENLERDLGCSSRSI